jgi:hypothetical protein
MTNEEKEFQIILYQYLTYTTAPDKGGRFS